MEWTRQVLCPFSNPIHPKHSVPTPWASVEEDVSCLWISSHHIRRLRWPNVCTTALVLQWPRNRTFLDSRVQESCWSLLRRWQQSPALLADPASMRRKRSHCTHADLEVRQAHSWRKSELIKTTSNSDVAETFVL